MKKIIILAFTLFCLAACSKVSNGVSDNFGFADSRELSFVVAKAASPSKAGGSAGSEFDNEDGFGAFAWISGSPTSEYWMENVNVTKRLEGGNYYWRPVVPYYWPNDNTVDFVCYAPYDDGHCWFTISDNPENSASDGYANRISAFVSLDGTAGDLLYADKVLRCTYPTTEETGDGFNAFTGIPIIFRHALARIGFKISCNAIFNEDESVFAKVTFKEATLSDVHNEGSLILDLQAEEGTESTSRWQNKNSDGTWDTTDSRTDIHDNIDGSLSVGTAPAYFISSRMAIPQKLDSQTLYLEVEIALYDTQPFAKDPESGRMIVDPETDMPVFYRYDAEGKPVKVAPDSPDYPRPTQIDDIHKHNSLYGLTEKSFWEMGHNIEYSIKIAPFTNEITFAPATDIWK